MDNTDYIRDRIETDWDYLLSFLPPDWEQMAADTGALLRLRNFKETQSLLRTLMIHLLEGCSLRETAVHAKNLGIANVSDVALLKRLNASGEWFRSMSESLINYCTPPSSWQLLPTGYDIKFVDATCVSKPGSTGTDWRIHYCIGLPKLHCEQVLITDHTRGESLCNFKATKGQLFLGDRAYAKRNSVAHTVISGGDVIVRMGIANLPLIDSSKKNEEAPFELLAHLRGLGLREVGDWSVKFKHNQNFVHGRVCAIRKSNAATEITRKKLISDASKKQKKLKPETLEAAAFVFVFTTLSHSVLAPSKVLKAYRGRWQIELAFKRLKSLLQLGALSKRDPTGAKSWLYGKMFCALLIETLIRSAETFSPWGYPIQCEDSMPLA